MTVATNIVIDTSAIIAVIVNEPVKSALAKHTQGAMLIAPVSVEWEIGDAFSAMLKRKRIGIEQALRAIALFREIQIRFVEVEIEESLRMADTLNVYAYDAYVLRCARKYKCPLLTLDRGLRLAAEKAAVSVIEV